VSNKCINSSVYPLTREYDEPKKLGVSFSAEISFDEGINMLVNKYE